MKNKEKSVIYFPLKYCKNKMYILFILSLLCGLSIIIMIYLKELIINKALNRNIDFILLLIIYSILGIYDKVSTISIKFITKSIKRILNIELKSFILKNIKYNDCEFIDSNKAQNMFEHFQYMFDKIEVVCQNYTSRIGNIVYFLGILVLIALDSYIILIIYLVLIFLCVFFQQKNSKYAMKFWQNYMSNAKKFNLFSEIMIDKKHSTERKLFNTTNMLNKEFNNAFDNAQNENKKLGIKRLQLDIMSELSGKIIVFISFLVWLPLLLKGHFTIGHFIILVENTFLLQQMIGEELNRENVFIEYRSIQMEYLNYISDMQKLIKNQQNLSDNKFNFEKGRITIDFQNVAFKYPGKDDLAISYISYKFDSNKKYVIVGENGAGKSTFMKLILGLYKPISGRILINGIDINNLSMDVKSNILTALLQDSNKYPGTLFDNINFTDDSIDENRQLRTTEYYDFKFIEYINSLPEKWNSKIGFLEDKNVDFSGGQWQKLFFMRATKADLPVLILDEPTSNLDPLAENDFYSTINKLCKDKLSIIISHRLGIVKYSDEILVLQKGNLVESGNHEELMQRRGKYYELYTEQKKLYNW